MIPRETVDKILDAAQIVDVVNDFVPLKKRGANYVACCPFHNEKTPSFYVSPAKGLYKCFGCGKAGSSVQFVMNHENMTYVEALKYLAQKYHIEVVEKEETAEEIAKRQRGESLLLVSEFACNFFKDSLKSGEGRAVGYQYFKSRGLEDSIIEKFGLGWADSSRASLSEAARAAGYKEEYLTDTGLSIKKDDGRLVDRFFERAMFPIHSPSGRVIAFGGRTLKSDKTVAKYVNSPETEIYYKSRSLYGIWFAKGEISRQDKCILVEGYLDVISMYQLGVHNVVASSGTSLTVEQIRLIKKYTDNVTIIYDGDAAGIKAALRGIGLVLKEGMNVKVVLLPDGHDPDSFARQHTLDEVRDFVKQNEQDFIGFKTDILLAEAGDDPLKKADLINDIADTVAMMPDAIKRSTYVQSCSRKFNIDPGILFDRIKNTRFEMLRSEKRQEENRRQREELATKTLESVGQSHDSADGDGKETEAIVSAGHTQVLEDLKLAPCEKELLRFILENGRTILEFDKDSEFRAEDGQQDTVAEFIDNSLAADGVSFTNTVYAKIYDEYFRLYDQMLTQDQIRSRLLNSQDETISSVTHDILEDKYILTVENYRNSLTSVGTQLVIFVPKSLMTYQINRLDNIVRDVSDKIGQAGNDIEKLMPLLEMMDRLNKARTELNNKLGRV